MAQEIGEQRRARHLRARHWRRLADECGLNGRLLLRKIEEIAQQIE
jgi:serine/threonine-protein kinase HipA